METANMMRVNARSGNFAGNGSSSQDKQQQHRQKVFALFDAINEGNIDAAKQAFQALVNFDSTTMANAQYVRLSQLLETGSIYLAQQLVKNIKSSFINALPLKSTHHVRASAPSFGLDGLHRVDLIA